MKKFITQTLPFVLLGGGAVLFGCAKTADVVNPRTVAISQNAVPTDVSLRAQNNWLFYLEQIEEGNVKDPTGQYFAKETIVDRTDDEQDDDGETLKGEARPKFDAAEGTSDWGYSNYVAQGGQLGVPKATACEDCPVSDGVGLAETKNALAVTAQFENSQGLGTYTGTNNPKGYIYDVKVVKGRSRNLMALRGYTIIPLDLNKGAGGQYIYLMFTRDPSRVQYGDEIRGENLGYSNGYRVIGPVRKMSSYAQRVGAVATQGFTAWHGYVPTWNKWLFGWRQPDLNDGAGGRFIYGFQGKGDNDGQPVEIGVVAGNSSRISPPAGWRKIDGSDFRFPGVDLNLGAGGDYIYFCIKTI